MPALMQTFYGSGDFVALRWSDHKSVESTNLFQPLGSPRSVTVGIQILQRTKTQSVVVPSNVVVGAAGGLAVGVHAHPLVEAVQRHAGVTPRLGSENPKQSGFTKAGRAGDKSAAYIAHMEIQGERRASRGKNMHQGRRPFGIKRARSFL